MNPRIAALFFVVALSEEGICQNPGVDFDVTQSHTEAEWQAFYSFDDPNLTEAQRQSAADFLARATAKRAQPTLVQLVAQSKPAVVQLEVDARDGQYAGTGFFISSDGFCVTAAHVVKGARSVEAITNDGTHYSARRIAYRDEDADIAILEFDDCRNVAYLVPAAAEAQEGQNIIVIGSPKQLSGTVSTGIVSAVREEAIQISAPISHGSSGSPVMNEDGHVIGVAVGGREDGQSLNFAAPLAEIWRGVAAVQEIQERKIRSTGN